MKKLLLFGLLVVVTMMMPLVLNAQDWTAVYAKKYTYIDNMLLRGKLPASPKSVISTGSGAVWLLLQNGQPIMFKGRARGVDDINVNVNATLKLDSKAGLSMDVAVSATSSLAGLGFDPKQALTLVVTPSDIFYVGLNYLAYRSINDAQWFGFSIDPRLKRGTGEVEPLSFSFILGATQDKEGCLVLTGIQDNLPAIAKLNASKQWEYTTLPTVTIEALKQATPKQEEGPSFLGFTAVTAEDMRTKAPFPEEYILNHPVTDKNGDIWMVAGFQGRGGVWRLSQGELKQMIAKPPYNLAASAAGDVYVATTNGIEKVNTDGSTELLTNWHVRRFYIDANNVLWFVPQVKVTRTPSSATQTKALGALLTGGIDAANKVMNAEQDDPHRPFGDSNLRRYDFKDSVLTVISQENSPLVGEVTCIADDGKGTFYITASNALGVLKMPELAPEYKADWHVTYETLTPRRSYQQKTWIAACSNGAQGGIALSATAENAMLTFISASGEERQSEKIVIETKPKTFYSWSDFFSCMAADAKGAIYLGTRLNGLYKYEKSGAVSVPLDSKLAGNEIIALTADKNNNLWIATGKILAKYDGTTMTYFNKKNSGLTSNDLTALYVDANNALWVGTDGDGLFRFDGTTWTVFTKKSGQLKNNKIISLAGYDSMVYATSPSNLYAIQGNAFTPCNLNTVFLEKPLRNALFADESGNVFLATSLGARCLRADRALLNIGGRGKSLAGNIPLDSHAIVDRMLYAGGIVQFIVRADATHETPVSHGGGTQPSTPAPPDELKSINSDRLFTFQKNYLLEGKSSALLKK
ncbi:MAG: hypothetical protein LBU92_02250 [Prevotellaceae bacterium]|jgi:streptogramin lyase|nr:hypothetical protein [Prevotellaceae bacterium]